ncbi:hypothetical protein [Burkholderia pseudomallei]|uniref:hypothetical protein n=1 Tax=Burkholderia pseudomallei TaxID=28450 RepID=UPI000055B5AD|nr:hypothetical protein [Burkholderia pseudomallei]AJX60852.1 hypothetical protein DP47_3418 [Burkholderia pseudomallei Pasteur 52237]EDO95532.1 hypothetical protein BURPSPAST_C1389 [Burkholderia pseudomallei Pasteur 52237]
MAALFNDSDEALKFAYRMEETTQFAINGYGTVRGGGALSPHELRAQAVFIRKIVAELTPAHLRAYGWAAYAWNELSTRGRVVVDRYIAKHVASDSPRLVQLLVSRYIELGDETRPTQRMIAKEMQIRPVTVQHWEGRVNEAMTALEAAFFDRVDRHFIRIGLIEKPAKQNSLHTR